MRLPALLLTLAAVTASSAERVQSPDASWRTIPTAHYRIHFPAHPSFRPFALEVASKIEGIHSLLEREVGFALKGPTDVVIQNPEAAANGSVMPLFGRPVVTLWTEPIASDSEISHSGNFIDLLVLHELVHLHHLMLPDRLPTVLERLSPAPATRVTLKCPGWITEGYATYLEGRLTGMGRPHGAYRALVMRQLALEGQLPSYEGLSGVSTDFPSGLRYQAGSAFMEWLVGRHPKGHGLWPDLWRRLASRRYPTFDAAFKATFGDLPQVLYGRYRAELTHTAVELERRVKAAGLREGELWSQAPDGFLRHLSVSPDGTALVAQAGTDEAARQGLQVFLLQDDGERAKREQEAKDRRKAKDPELPEEAPELRRVRTPEHTLATDGPSAPSRPRWEPDGAVAYEVVRRNAEGVARRETRRWHPRPMKPQAATLQHLHPEYRPGGWTLRIDGRALDLPFEPFGPLAYDSARRLLYASTPVDGIHSLVRFSWDGTTLGPREVLTRTAGGAFFPAPTPDGKHLFYVQPTGRGSQIRRLSLEGLAPMAGSVARETAPLVPDTVLPRPDGPSAVPPAVTPPPDQPYRVADSHVTGRRVGFLFDPSSATYQLGLGGNDILGRLNWTALGALPLPNTHARGPRGAQLGAAWRGWAWAPSLHAFSSLVRPSVQRFEPMDGWDRERRGLELAVTREWWTSHREGRAVIAAARERVTPLGSPDGQDRTLLSLDLRQRLAWNRHQTFLGLDAALLAQQGRTEARDWRLWRGQVGLAAGIRSMTLLTQYSRGQVSGDASVLDRFTLGGAATGLVPRSLEGTLVVQAALPAHSATGDRFERWRASLDGALWIEGTRLWTAGGPRPAYTRVVGFDLLESVEALLPSTRQAVERYLGRLEVRAGLQVPLDGPMKRRTVVTLGVIHRF